MGVLAYYLHDLNPYIFRLNIYGFPFEPRWYGFAYLMGFLAAYLLLKKLSRDGMLRLKPKLVADLVLNCCIFGVLVGGRLGYCLLYKPDLLLFSSEFPYWGVLKVWEGGMSAHGGVLFTILTLMVIGWKQQDLRVGFKSVATLVGGVFLFGGVGWFAGRLATGSMNALALCALGGGLGWMIYFGWRKAIAVVNLGDAACMVVPIGLCLGRIANFINGELYGHPTDVPWAVQFPQEIYSPTNGRILASVADKLPDVFQKLIRLDLLPPAEWFTDEGFKQMVIRLEVLLKAHQPAAMEAVQAILPARHPSQLYESLLEGVLLFTICWTIGRLWRKDGMASGAFLTFYPVMRIIGEQFRVGDTPQKVLGVEMSLGVIYSLLMLLAGMTYWGYWIRKNRAAVWIPAKEEEDEPEEEIGKSEKKSA